MHATETKWKQWKGIDSEEYNGPIGEVIAPNAIVRFTNDEKVRSVVVRRGETKPELTFGTKEPRHISIDDERIPEIVGLDSRAFCQVAAYVQGIASNIGVNDFDTMRIVSQDYERVIEAARMRAAQGVINMDEAAAVYALHSVVVVQGMQASAVMRHDLPA